MQEVVENIIACEAEKSRKRAPKAETKRDSHPNVRAIIKHDLAPIFDSHQIDGAPGFPAYRYRTRIQFGKLARVTVVEITNVTQAAPLGIYSASLVNSNTGSAEALGYRPA